MILATILVLLIGVQRLWELRRARRNSDIAMKQGGREVGAEHYWMFFVLHGGWLLGMQIEAALRHYAMIPWLSAVAVIVFVAAEVLRAWAISSLGVQWNTRIIIVPGWSRVVSGPYAFMSHPNYVAVALELISVPLIIGAWYTAIIATVVNAVILLAVRIPAEERALQTLINEKSP